LDRRRRLGCSFRRYVGALREENQRGEKQRPQQQSLQ
jgi:hypothetical protein